MRSVVLAALAAATLSAAPAFSQTSAAAIDQAPFTGARVEGILGWDRVQGGGHDDGLMYGIGVGYDVQVGGFVLAPEAEIADSDVKACDGLGTAASPRLCLKTGRDIYVGGRVGKVIGSNALLYAKAGYTNARAKLTQQGGTGGSTTLDRTDLDGFRVGGGVEYALNQNMFVKAEYRYSNYEAGVERHQVVGGVGFRF